MVTDVRPLHQPLEGAADPHLEAGVDRAGGLVEDQQVGVGQVRAQQRDELPLPGRQRLAALADLGVEAARAAREPVVEAELGRRGEDLVLGRVEPAVARRWRAIVSSKRKPSCGTSTTLRRSEDCGDPAYVDAVEQHRAVARVHQPGQQLGEGGLARAGLPDDRDPGAGVDGAGRRRGAPAARRGRRTSRRRSGRRSARAAAPRRPAPGSTRSAGVSRMPMTRRQLAMAFWASVRIWVPICTGPTNSETRNAKASTWPAVMSPAKPSQTPIIDHAGVGQAGREAAEGERDDGEALRAGVGLLVLLDRGVDARLGAVLDGVGADHGGADDRLGDRDEHARRPGGVRRCRRPTASAGTSGARGTAAGSRARRPARAASCRRASSRSRRRSARC